MATRKALRPFVAVVLLCAACAGQADAPESLDRAALSQALLDDAAADDEPGCSAAVGIEGEVVWTGVRGVADLSTGAGLTPDTPFDIASVSKQFTATAVLLLVQDDRLTIDDTLAQHVAGLPGWAEKVSVAQLMHQTSGIPDYIGLLEDAGYGYSDRTTNADAMRVLAKVQELDFDPGERFEYSNSNYLLLGEIAQRVTSQPLATVLAAEIFVPLGLAMVLDPIGTVSGEAVPYEWSGGEYVPSRSGWEQVGDGSIKTTPSQLVRWADNYRTGALGGRRLLDAQLAGAVDTDEGTGDRYGAGINVYADGTLGHDGSWAGFVSDFGISADRRAAVAVSCNTDAQDPTAIAAALGELWE
ncbi:serine hydrolase [Mycolicibacterium sp. CR10]|uniref:serine hydrolase domain-containing protein n=1 Tax=Mycolicibacterium sp. CR10 TaxID=2562314 RepID=UPI0010BF966C|nr:serine hydrolase domain-containing protein [Mycolicibacterium sp. CR10]